MQTTCHTSTTANVPSVMPLFNTEIERCPSYLITILTKIKYYNIAIMLQTHIMYEKLTNNKDD